MARRMELLCVATNYASDDGKRECNKQEQRDDDKNGAGVQGSRGGVEDGSCVKKHEEKEEGPWKYPNSNGNSN